MGFAKISEDDREKMRSEMHKGIDIFCDQLKCQDMEQAHRGIEQLKNNFNEAALDIVFAHCENNQESTPLLPEQQQELRNRVHGQKPGPEQDSEPEGSPNQSPGAQKTGKSFCEEVLSLFQEMLSQLQKTWLDVLNWVQESLVSVVKFILSQIMNFCSIAAQSFSSLFLVQGVA
ncbi:PREDICTED: interleukin-32-like [Myotis brandtii]|uniref:interleukin-32-like n=1 Tax=Myotis brandtii TaxID=109478 RepID=UPI0007043BF1|nr:PREDICTED: interleukin-32-like [Myotis brandtii]